jgi:hypothetical protein
MIYLLLTITIASNAVMDAIMSNDSFASYGIWFSRDGWKTKHAFADWMAQFIPEWLSVLLSGTVLVMFTELYKFAKMIMILSFLIAIFGFTWYALAMYIVWGALFSIYYTLIR